MTTALWHTAPDASELRDAPLGEGGCLIRAICSAVSPGTERLVASGGVPPAMYGEMGVPGMGGGFPFPVAYGYSLVGRVEEGPMPLMGRLVHCLRPHQDRVRAAAEACFLVPEGVPPERATLASNLETALNATWDGQVRMGERAAVIGFGTVGSLVARLLSMTPGVEVAIGEVAPAQAALAEAMGFAVYERPPAERFDVAFHTSGTGAGLQAALDAVGPEGRVIELSWYGEREVALGLGGRFHSGRKRVVSSQVSQLPPDMRPRWDYRRRKAAVFRILQDPAFDVHVTERVAFQDLPGFFDRLRAGRRGLSVAVTYD